MKKLLAAVLFSAVTSLSFAGDAAAFLDIGFSADGKSYIFGEYGKTDMKFQAWAEIYTVDIAKNDFVPDAVYKIQPSFATTNISGKTAYENLLKRSSATINKYNCSPCNPENVLYVKNNGGVIVKPVEKNKVDSIVFQDFEASTDEQAIYYRIKLVPTVNGKGKNCKSSYYISMQREDENGHVLRSWTVGNPEIVRQSVSSYEIEQIFTDSTGTSMVFVVQKTIEDETGTSIRYMVETVKI